MKIRKLKSPFIKLNKWRIAKKVKRQLLKRRKWDYELEMINESWIIRRIQEGQVGRRKELTTCQARIKEIDKFIKFLKSK